MVATDWPLGQVAEVYPGQDGLVRVVSVKTARGIYRRPVVKVAVLIPIVNYELSYHPNTKDTCLGRRDMLCLNYSKQFDLVMVIIIICDLTSL